jgi:hypothetical protein
MPQLLICGEQTKWTENRLSWPASFRNGGRLQIGMVAGFKSESLAGLNRNSQVSAPAHFPASFDRKVAETALAPLPARGRSPELFCRLCGSTWGNWALFGYPRPI